MWRETTRITMSIAGLTLFGAETFSEADELGAALTTSLKWVDDQKTSVLPLVQMAVKEGAHAARGARARAGRRPVGEPRGAAAGARAPVARRGQADEGGRGRSWIGG